MTTLPDVRGTRPGVDRLPVATAAENAPSVTSMSTPTDALDYPAGTDAASEAIAPAHRMTARTSTTLAPATGVIEAPRTWLDPLRSRARKVWEWAAGLDTRWRYPLLVFLLTRALYMVIAVIDHFVRTGANGLPFTFGHELSNWDGGWYLRTAIHGYAHQLDLSSWNTLGFMPLYPLMMWTLSHALAISDVLSGMIIATLGGAVATVLIARLVARWWGEQAVRPSLLLFCLFPGTIVFSMVYTEGLLLALVAGCLLALEDRRWVLAGVLAGFATAVEPVAVAIIPACAAATLVEIRRRGWGDRQARRSLWAPLLAPLGAVGFAIFLWAWTGTPLASYETQRYDWHETTTPLALPRAIVTLCKQALGLESPPHPNVDLNLVVAMIGTAFLVWGLRYLWRSRKLVSIPALVWTAGVALMTLTSNSTPPNARMLLCAFPVIVVIGAHLRGRAYARLLGASTVLLVAMGMVTFVSTGLRP